ncbi:MAG: tryptophan--tRNA ligase [Bacteroidia bacterium]
MDIVVSGIRSTGRLHLGNYFGAVTNFVKMQNDFKCFFFVADYHSLTTHPKPEHLQENVRQVLAECIACGIDPEQAALYVQSDVQEVTELYLLLNMNAYIGELQRVASFKEKIRMHPDNVNAGLLTYPTLMAADILIHKADKVPVGKDQEQHLEMTRNFAQRFNRIYNVSCFPEPVAFNFGTELVKVPGLDGSGKMGKSEGEGNAVFISDSEEQIKKKVMKAVTDSGPVIPGAPRSEPVQNLFTLMNLVSAKETLSFFEQKYNEGTIRYGDMKKQLAEDINNFISPLREKINETVKDDILLKSIAAKGAEKARISACATIKEVRNTIGFMNA